MSVGSMDLAQRIGVTHRQLNYWVLKGYLTPDGGVTGTGNQHWFSGTEVRVAYDLAALANAGVKPEIAAKIARRNCAEFIALNVAMNKLMWRRLVE
jgi:hypothetical protein